MTKEYEKKGIMEAIGAFGDACEWEKSQMQKSAREDNFTDFLEEHPEVQEAINEAFRRMITDYNCFRFGIFAQMAPVYDEFKADLAEMGKNMFNYGGLGDKQ